MSHETTVAETRSGWWVWACTCGDRAPNAIRWKIGAQYHANRHRINKEKL
jgi:hypothetical protein